MTDGAIRIVVGAALNRSEVDSVFGAVEKRAERAGSVVRKALGGGSGTGRGNPLGKGFDEAAKSAQRAEREIDATWKKQLADANRVARAQDKIFNEAARTRVRAEAEASREIVRGFRTATRERARELKQQEQDEARSNKRAEAERRKFADRTSHRAVRFLFPNPIGAFGMASRIGGDLLRGAGVDFSTQGMAHRAVRAQEVSTLLSNQGFMPQEHGANAHRVAATTLENEARHTAQSQGFTTEQMLAAQTKFVDLTGNLDDARKAMPAIAKLSGATTTDPEKMAEAWANVSRHMGDIPDKAAKVEALMRLIAGQGRVGSIEIKDEAKDLGKIAAMADKFAGDRGESIAKLATMAQMARAEGGAASSKEAATSIVSFASTFTAPARVKQLLGAGLKEEDIFEMQGTGKNRVRAHIQDPFEIIKKVLEKTGGDIGKFSSIFKSVMSQRAVNSLAAAYNSGGGRNMGAVDKQIAAFGKEATLTSEFVDEAQGERMKTAATQAVVFQEKLDEVGRNVAVELLPAMQALAPVALRAASGLGDIVTWAAKNPLEAVGAAVTAAIARAGIESAFRAGIERAITSSTFNVGAASATIGSATLAVAALTLAWGQADELGKALGADSRATDVLMPGAKKGEFSWGQAADDASKVLGGGIFGYLASKGGEIVGDYARHGLDGKSGRAATSEEYLAQHPREALPFRADRYDPQQRSPELQQLDPSALGHGVAAGLRGGGPIQVIVANAKDIGTAQPPGPSVPEHGRSANPSRPR